MDISVLLLHKKTLHFTCLWLHHYYFITCRLVGTIVNVNLVGLGSNVINALVILVVLAAQILVLMVGLALHSLDNLILSIVIVPQVLLVKTLKYKNFNFLCPVLSVKSRQDDLSSKCSFFR